MNNSPFEIFRRNLKPLMVLLTGLALFAFVVLPVLDTYMRRSNGMGGDGVVATFDGRELTRSRAEYFTRNHQSTVRFLFDLANQTIARGGIPQTAGFQYDAQNQQVQSIGINSEPSIDGTIRTFMLSAQASQDGFELDDTALQVWLSNFCNEEFTLSQIDAMLMKSTQNQMGRPHLFEQLRSHLLANVYLNRGYAGLFIGDNPMSGPLMTPDEQWANFLKLNQNARVTTYGVLVNDYLDQTNENPTEAEIVAVYEEGKDRDPNDQLPDPAFHRRYSATFEYLVADFQTFLSEEVEKLTEEQLRAEYERRLKGGEYQLPEQPPADEAMEESDETEETEASGDASDDAASDDSDAPETAAESAEESASDGDDGASETEETSSDEPAADADAPDDSESTEEAPATEASDEQAQLNRADAVRLVAMQQSDEPGSDDNPADDGDDGQESSEKADDPESPAEESSEPTQDDEPSGDDSTQSEEQPAETSEDASDEPAEEMKEGEDSESEEGSEESAEASDEDNAEGEPEKDEPKVESFEDVRQSIAESMAAPAASRRINEALTQLNGQMTLYFKKRAIYESNRAIGQTVEEPSKPELSELAGELGMQYEIIGPHSEVTILENEPIANSFEMSSQIGRGASFTQIMFGYNSMQGQVPAKTLYSPLVTTDGPSGKQYISWKINETDPYTPELNEVRAEVVTAIRMKEARELARAAAEEIAKQAAADPEKSLQDFVPESKKDNVKEGLGPFSWMDSFGFAGASIGNVPELDSVGNEFMEATFMTKLGDYSVAMNQPGRVVYVVKPTAMEPQMEELRQQFKQPNQRTMAMLLGNGSGPILNEFYDSIDEKAGFTSYLEE